MPDLVERVQCDMSPEDFEAKFVRVGTPAIITGCNFTWPTKYGEMSVEKVYSVSKLRGVLSNSDMINCIDFQMFHGNETFVIDDGPLPPLPAPGEGLMSVTMIKWCFDF